MWLEMFFRYALVLAVIVLTDSKTNSARIIRKRQLYREQVLPHSGGKVPESAFWTDRLALNQLNARGIYSSTGVYLEHRPNKEHPHRAQPEKPTMKVRVPGEGRFVADAGRYHVGAPRTLDTTYVISDPVGAPIKPNLLRQSHPAIPYMSLKLMRHYNSQKKHGESPWNDIDNFSTQVKREYEPFLKKLHEMD